jgi:hypothetical protein
MSCSFIGHSSYFAHSLITPKILAKLDANILKIGALVIIIGFRFLIIMTHQQWNIGLHWSPGISLVTASTFPAVRQPQLTRKVPETLKYISLD